MVGPSQRREMTRWAVAKPAGGAYPPACAGFAVDSLLRVTFNEKSRGFGIRYLYLRNVEHFTWNHTQVYGLTGAGAEPADQPPQAPGAGEAPASDRAEDLQMGLVDGLHVRPAVQTFRLFNVLDDFSREGLGIEVVLSLPSARVSRSLEQIIVWRDAPLQQRSGIFEGSHPGLGPSPGYPLGAHPAGEVPVERQDGYRTVRYDWRSQTLFDSITEAQESATR